MTVLSKKNPGPHPYLPLESTIIEDHMKSMFHALHSYVNIPFPPLQVPTPRNRKIKKEVLRIYTPAFVIARRAVHDDEIGGYFIPKNSYVFVLPYFIQRHPDFWEQPEVFDPERFLPERSQERPTFAYLPFGGGPHVCIGNSFADMEIKLTIATLVQRYRVRLTPSDHPAEPKVSLTMTAKYGLPMTIYPR